MPPPGSIERRDGRRTALVLALLIALVAVAREVGIGFQLPVAGLADERVYIQHIAAFQSGVANPAALPGAATYPYLVSKLALATWSEPACTSTDVADHLAAASALAIHIRRVVALLSLIAIPALYLLVRAFASRSTALLAAALCGTSVFAEVLAQQARPHGAILGLSLLALACAVRLQLRPTFARALLAGTAAGLSFAALQSGIAMLVPVTVAIFLARGVALRRRLEFLAVTLLLSGLAFVWAYHYLFVDHIDRGVQPGHALLGEGAFSLDMLDGSGFAALARSLWTYEPLGVVAALLAAAVASALALRARWSRDRRVVRTPLRLDPRGWSDGARSAAVVASYLVPYLIVFGLYERTYTRYGLPLVPFLAWFVAWALTPRGSWTRKPLAWTPAVLLVCAQGALLAQLARVRAEPDTLEQAARWIEHETPVDSRIALLQSDDLPLLRRADQRAELRRYAYSDPHHHWLSYQSRLDPGPWDANARDVITLWGKQPDRAVEAMLADGADYCILRTFQRYRPGGLDTLRRDLRRNGTVVATFAPIEDPVASPFASREEFRTDEKVELWIRELARAHCTGNVVEIWKLERSRPTDAERVPAASVTEPAPR